MSGSSSSARVSPEVLKYVRAYKKCKRLRFKKALRQALQDDTRFATGGAVKTKRRGVRSGRNYGVSKLNRNTVD